MANEITAEKNNLSIKLKTALDSACDIVTRGYLEKLGFLKLVRPSEQDLDIDITECGRFYQLTKLVLNDEENFLDKLTTIVNVASSLGCTISTIINSDGVEVKFYFGIISKNQRLDNDEDETIRTANEDAFKGALTGNLMGSNLLELEPEDIEQFKKDFLVRKGAVYSAVSGIVALRNADDKSIEGYVQGIENLVDSLKGQKYAIVMIADSLKNSEIHRIKQGYELLHTELSTLAGNSVTISESDTLSLSTSRTVSLTNGVTHSIALTQSTTKTSGWSFSGGVSAGWSLGPTATVNANAGINQSTGNTYGRTTSQVESVSRTQSITTGQTNSKTAGRSLQLNYENRSVKSFLEKIDKHIERLDECASFGAFECATYIIADSRETALTVASNYNALMRGQDSNVQASYINTWHKTEDTRIIGQYLGALTHPRFWQNQQDKLMVTAASVISGNELAIQIGLPKKSINGVTVVPMASFGRNVAKNGAGQFTLGNLYHMGQDEGDGEQKVAIDVESLSMHTFITGSTGSGKSTAIYSILDKLILQNVKNSNSRISFLVIEPAKGEYKDRFGGYNNVSVYGTNCNKTDLLRINPFSFPSDIHVLEHIDRLVEIFNVCWPMYAAMPAVLKDSISRAYIIAGWNLDTSVCKYYESNGVVIYPTFADVLNQINAVMDESEYSKDSKGDYKGALCTRVKSLTNGLYGQIFTSNELSAEDLFDKNVIVDLSRVGSSETKALIMGLLVMKLQEHRMANAKGGNAPLKHVTVLEEAHNLLRRTSTEQSTDGANLLGKSVEMLANAIAEMRTYGEGFVIADQSPGLMDMSVIRNTNTKIILRLPDLSDRELVGKAANLNDEQIRELSRLQTFVAAVYQNNWLEPVLCNIEHNFKTTLTYRPKHKDVSLLNKNKEALLDFLVLPVEKRNKLDDKYIDNIIKNVVALPVSADTKVSFIKYTKTSQKDAVQRFRGHVLYNLFNSDVAFSSNKQFENDIMTWYDKFKDVLEPSVEALDIIKQKKIIAMLARERALLENTEETKRLFKNLMGVM